MTPTNTSSPREERDKIVEFVINTTKQLSVTGWWPKDGVALADVCSLGGGEKGASYSYSHWAPMGTDYAGDAQKVAAYWRTLGMNVRIADSTPWPTVYAEGGPVLRASFDTSTPDNSYSVGAVARCAPGHAFTLNDEDDAQRNTGVVLPGDEGTVKKWDPKNQPSFSPPSTPTPQKPK
ncbi:hypothetical protein [Rathayibacter toxicus]|uniref:hypothetical protein n=1 Tax=Rathayibacter toxicus TaxID=145458 RepID=UPI000CE790AE|nr:hypothetical protein [Rathayibacter toxicus]PPI56762.1 hypothetical protein C5D35_00460 [Rathayibacter toxicus]QOD10477.1 hypothetical protein BSG36_00235 [Rathayibacter toxicus]QWL27212.1 hypothetical protein E2R33_00225 [Rathayibacter toxicus]QWL29348.1 hypothetical protein E2R34_00225 [Rathayibacter toxicus]QWL31429.1 hypothetical protein E2R35_00205 [Rathayibacter toxicus]